MMNNAFYFISKDIFVLEIFKFCPDLFVHAGRRLDKKGGVNFKIYDVTTWKTNIYNTQIARFPKSKSNQAMKFGQLTNLT